MDDQHRDPGSDGSGAQPPPIPGTRPYHGGFGYGPPPRPEPPAPFSDREIMDALRRPHHALDLILGSRGRFGATVLDRERLSPLLLLLLLGGMFFALPYGLLAPEAGWSKIFLLFTGSVLICFPSLHVFSRYLGFELDFLQNLALSLLVSAVAAMVTFGFAPIIWFINATGGAGDEDLAFTAGISLLLLVVALLMGMAQMTRVLFAAPAPWHRKVLHFILTMIWFVLLFFINFRMARNLGILAWLDY